MMRTLARSLALVLAICLPHYLALADAADNEKTKPSLTVQQWLGVKEEPRYSLGNLVEDPRPTTSLLEEDYFKPPVPGLSGPRCGRISPLASEFPRKTRRLCHQESRLGLQIKAFFFDDSLLAFCPSLKCELPGLEECAMLTKFEYFKSTDLKSEQADDSATKAPKFHAQIHSLLQSQALFKLADAFGADSERELKWEPLANRGFSLSYATGNSGRKLASLTSDRFDTTRPIFEQTALAFQPPGKPQGKFILVEPQGVGTPVILMDSNLDELLITVSKLVIVSDARLLNTLSYPKWSARANVPPKLAYNDQRSPYTSCRFVTAREHAAQNVWTFPPLIAMVISEASLEATELHKPIFEQFDSKTTESLERFEPMTRVLAMNQRGRFSR